MMTHRFYSTLPEEARLIRTEVFIDEQGFHDEFDDKDNSVTHVVLFDDNIPIATGRVFPESKQIYYAGRIAVRKHYRGKNYGAEVMKLLENKAKEQGAEILAVSAQCRAQRFYEKLGYTASGDVYLDEYCEHIHMEKKL